MKSIGFFANLESPIPFLGIARESEGILNIAKKSTTFDSASPKLLYSPREHYLSRIENQKLFNIIDDLYRPGAKYGSGSTADAVRYETQTGNLLSKSGHITKAVEYRDSITRLIDGGKLSANDLQIARMIRSDLQDSLTSYSWDKVYPERVELKP